MTNPKSDPGSGGHAVPASKKSGNEGGGGPLAGLRQWLIDSYRGLYKIVLEPSMPRRYQVYLIIFGAILGLIWAWGIYPAVFTGANPNRLNQAAQDQWVKMVAVAVSPNIEYNEQAAADLLSRVPDPVGTINRLLADPNLSAGDAEALQNLLTIIPPDLAGTPQPDAGGFLGSVAQILALIFLIAIVTPIFMLLWRILIYPNIVAGAIDRFKQITDKDYAEQKHREADVRAAARAAAEAKRSMVIEADVNLGAPVMKTLSIFSAGREYDDSFEIELPLDQGGDFLGQCGAAIAESVAPDPVAIELWLFDMFTQQDKKRVFITEAGYNDPGIRGRIAAALDDPSDIVVAQNGAKLIVESNKLRLQGEMKDLQVDASGRFQKFQMPIAAWRKDGTGVGMPSPVAAGGASLLQPPPPATGARPMSDYDNLQFAPPPTPAAGRSMSDYDDIQFEPPPTPTGGRSMADYDDIQFDAPPQMPGQAKPQTLQPPPLQPLQPPPLQRPGATRPPEDDPFGGTGDFTPLGKN